MALTSEGESAFYGLRLSLYIAGSAALILLSDHPLLQGKAVCRYCMSRDSGCHPTRILFATKPSQRLSVTDRISHAIGNFDQKLVSNIVPVRVIQFREPAQLNKKYAGRGRVLASPGEVWQAICAELRVLSVIASATSIDLDPPVVR